MMPFDRIRNIQNETCGELALWFAGIDETRCVWNKFAGEHDRRHVVVESRLLFADRSRLATRDRPHGGRCRPRFRVARRAHPSASTLAYDLLCVKAEGQRSRVPRRSGAITNAVLFEKTIDSRLENGAHIDTSLPYLTSSI